MDDPYISSKGAHRVNPCFKSLAYLKFLDRNHSVMNASRVRDQHKDTAMVLAVGGHCTVLGIQMTCEEALPSQSSELFFASFATRKDACGAKHVLAMQL